MADTYDHEIDRGSTAELAWRFKDEDEEIFDLTGSRLILSVVDRNGSLVFRKDSDDDEEAVIDVGEGTFTVTLTTDETRLIALGRLTKYEVERWVGGAQDKMVSGWFEGVGGVNND